jgi:hypothetical protein
MALRRFLVPRAGFQAMDVALVVVPGSEGAEVLARAPRQALAGPAATGEASAGGELILRAEDGNLSV